MNEPDDRILDSRTRATLVAFVLVVLLALAVIGYIVGFSEYSARG